MVFHDQENKQIIPIFDWISCDHEGGTIRNNLSKCVDNILVYSEKEIFPKGVVTDHAWGFINAVQLVFNRKTIDETLDLLLVIYLLALLYQKNIFLVNFAKFIFYIT